jgi:type IX secretion system PorP/SprF family membrane protein
MRKILLTVLMLFMILQVFSQDPQFSQYYQAPLYINPGFTGITPQHRLVANNRIQWPSLPQAFTTYSLSYDFFVDELRSGFGLLLTTDKIGTAGWRTTTAGFSYSYKIKLSNKIVFSPGLYFGYGNNGIDRSKLVFEDELKYNQSSIDESQKNLGNQNYMDLGAGFLFYSKEIWVGASFSHMNRPNLSVLGDESRLAVKTSVHGGAKISLNRSVKTIRQSYLTPSFIYRMQGNSFSQLDIGLNYHIDPISIGLWYRGKPFQNNIISGTSQDAMILTLGLYFKKLTVGYSYDFTISQMQTAAGGAHEISLVYEFVTKRSDKKEKKKYKLIPCPSFNSKPGFWN